MSRLAGDVITDMVNRKLIEEVDEKAVTQASNIVSDQMMVSIAISLKRIADALQGEGPNILTAPINSYGEGLGDAIQGQMTRGRLGIDQYEGRPG